jgi:flagellar hook-associated protein 3 FlgL
VSNSGISGTVNIGPYVADDNDIVLEPQELGLSSQSMEDNIFSTMNAAIDAGLSDDTDELHNLLGNFDVDADRVLQGRGRVGALVQRFTLLENRLADEKTSFTEIMSNRIDLDYADAAVKFQQESNIYNAALSVAGQIIPLSLVDYL